MLDNICKYVFKVDICGVVIEWMVSKFFELLIGLCKDVLLGFVIVVGKGGIVVEVYWDIWLELLLMNMVLV